MKFIGHTMAVPGIKIVDAIKKFSSLAMDGIEIVVQEEASFYLGLPELEIKNIIEASKAFHLPITTLTPYFWNINSNNPEEQRNNINGLIETIHLAERMGAHFVRAYGGSLAVCGSDEEKFSRTVEALLLAGTEAARSGITILIENHPGTMTRTGRETARMINNIDMNCVKALYDPCNVLYDTDEDWLTTLTIQQGLIGYIHCKDYKLVDGKRMACAVGEGIVPWLEIMDRIESKDYCLSFEYEKRWYPDQLEDADIGLPKCMDYMRRAIR